MSSCKPKDFMSKHSKREIIHGLINFDEEIYEYLDAMYREKVIQHVFKNSGTREDGEELYQYVIFEIHQNIKQGNYNADGRGTFEEYFWTVAKRKWDNLRKQIQNFKYNKKEIIHGIITEDEEMYKYLDAKYRNIVIKHVCDNSGLRQDGEELYQDVILEIYRNIKRGKYNANGDGTFEGYFWTIARRKWIDKLRKRKPDFVDPPSGEIPDIPEAKEEAEYLRNRRGLAIRKYLKQLSPDEQDYIRLYYSENKPKQATIAEHFGITHGNFRKKLHEIRKKLRKMIADDPEFGTSLFLYPQ